MATGPLIPIEQLELFRLAIEARNSKLLDRVGSLYRQLDDLVDPTLAHAIDDPDELLDLTAKPLEAEARAKHDQLSRDLQRIHRKRYRYDTQIPERRVLRRELDKLRELFSPGRERRVARLERWRALGMAPRALTMDPQSSLARGGYGFNDPDEWSERSLRHIKYQSTGDLRKVIKSGGWSLVPPWGRPQDAKWALARATAELERRGREELLPKMMSRRGFLRGGADFAAREISSKIPPSTTAGFGRRDMLKVFFKILRRGR
jgi:hypothetical protein